MMISTSGSTSAPANARPLALSAFPHNDAFENRIALTGSSLVVTGRCAGATLDPSEVLPPGASGGSVWWTWTAPFSGTITLQSIPDSEAYPGTRYSLAVYTGSELASLKLITNGSRQVVFPVLSGTTYQFAVFAYSQFPFTLKLTDSAPPVLQFTSPAPGSEWKGGSPLPLLVEASDDRSVETVEFYDQSKLVGTVASPPYALTYTLPLPTFNTQLTLSAVAVDNDGLRSTSSVAIFVVPRPPDNDAFADAIQLSGTWFSIPVNTRYATLEPGEPNTQGSIWFSWTAPSSQVVTFVTEPPASGVSLAVFTGSSVDSLTLIGRGSADWSSDYQTRLRSAAEAGVEYRIALCGGWEDELTLSLVSGQPPAVTLTSPAHGASYPSGAAVLFSADATPVGSVRHVQFYVDEQLVATAQDPPYHYTAFFTKDYGTTWHSVYAVAVDNNGLSQRTEQAVFGIKGPPPANDMFASRIPLTGSFLSVTGTTASATMEAGEPVSHSGSVWWSWTAPQSGLTSIVLDADQHGANIWVYTGDSLPNLAPVPGLSIASGELPRPLTFPATAGQQYQLAVGWSQPYGGPVSLVLAQSPPPAVNLITPTNNQYYFSGDPILLSAEATAPGGSIREVAYYNQDSGALLGVVTNAPWSATIFITNTGHGSFGDVSGPVIARVTDNQGLVGYSEPHMFTVLPRPPTNDAFENRLVVEGCSLSVTGSTVNAWGEGYGTGSGPSVWWSWTAPKDGWATIDADVPMESFMGVFTGSALEDLILVAGTNVERWAYSARLTFQVSSGTSYHIVISTPSYGEGEPVSWNLYCSAPSVLSITSPAERSRFVAGSSVTVSAQVTTPGPDAAPTVEVYFDSGLIRTLTQPPYTATINLAGATIGNHFLEVRATSPHGLVSRSSERYIEILGLPPANDDFANRAVLSGFLASVPVDSTYATREPGEPNASTWPEEGTLWWAWTAPADGTLSLGMTEGGSSSLSLWTGATLSTLRFEAAGSPYNPALAVHVLRGTTWQIACSGYKSALQLFFQPEGFPAFSRVAPTEDGLFHLTFETLAPQPWVIEASSDLYQWQPVSTNLSQQNVLEFVDPESQSHPQRFYRFTSPEK